MILLAAVPRKGTAAFYVLHHEESRNNQNELLLMVNFGKNPVTR